MKSQLLIISGFCLNITLTQPWITETDLATRKGVTNDNKPRALLRGCTDGKQCVPISRCMDECDSVKRGLLQSNEQFRRHLRSEFCGLDPSNSVKVCCAKRSITISPHCPDLDEDFEEMPSTPSCGRRFSTRTHITGGEKTNPGEWPWMARLLYKDIKDEDPYITHCGGSLISDRLVLTAAHCITDKYRPTTVSLGESDVTTDYDCLVVGGCRTRGKSCFDEEECAPKNVEIDIKRIIVHDKYKHDPDCTECVPIFDVALLVLKEPVKFSDFIQPVCLPKLESKHSRPLTVTGWGNSAPGPESNFKPSTILQELKVVEVPLQECNSMWKSRLRYDLLTSHMCATTRISGKTTCLGDSGSPLVREVGQVWELEGVVSFGISTCGNADYPLGFTRVRGEVDSWIRSWLK